MPRSSWAGIRYSDMLAGIGRSSGASQMKALRCHKLKWSQQHQTEHCVGFHNDISPANEEIRRPTLIATRRRELTPRLIERSMGGFTQLARLHASRFAHPLAIKSWKSDPHSKSSILLLCAMSPRTSSVDVDSWAHPRGLCLATWTSWAFCCTASSAFAARALGISAG